MIEEIEFQTLRAPSKCAPFESYNFCILSAVQRESDFTADSILQSCLFQAFVVIASYEIKLFHNNEEHGKYSATKAAYDQDQNMSTVRKCIHQYSFVMVCLLEISTRIMRTCQDFFLFPQFRQAGLA